MNPSAPANPDAAPKENDALPHESHEPHQSAGGAAGELPLSRPAGGDPPRSVTWRSLLIGLLASIGVCSLTPYNDFVLSDTSLAAGYLPLIAVLIQFLLIVGLNAPLHRFAPSQALRPGELAIILLMVLIACSLPNWGLMRFWAPTPVAPFFHGQSKTQFWNAFLAMDLPGWLFPVEKISEGNGSPIMEWFYYRAPQGEAVPYGAWIKPLLVWGIFIIAMLLTLLALARLVIEQWIVNERLPFPLVQVQMALIEAPRKGFALNDLFRSRSLWIGLGAVFLIHGLISLSTYLPKYVPVISLGYDFNTIFSEPPLTNLRSKVKAATLSFTIIGVAYFIRSKVAFSLWGIYLLVNLVDVQQAAMQSEMSSAAWADQHLGASAAFILGMLWIGRHHWMLVLRNAFGRGSDARYRLAFWTVVAGVGVMIGWLAVMGVQIWFAGLIVLFILSAHLIVSRVVAETGLPFFRSGISVAQIYSNFAPGAFSGRDIYFASVFNVLGPLTTRDGIMGFATQGLGVVHQAGTPQREQRRVGAAILLALVVGIVVAAGMTLYCHYSYPTPMTRDIQPQGNNFGAVYVQERDVVNPVIEHSQGRFAAKSHSPALHMTIGFVVMLGLEIASLRWASWPLLPVGYVASHGAFIQNAWFSILVGWLAKLMIVRFGGSGLFQSARPFFIGIIFGESLAAGFWLIVNAILVANGHDSQTVKFLL